MSTEKDPNTFEVSVAESIGMSELSPGGATAPAPAEEVVEKTDEEIQAEREEIIRKVLERKVELADKYVAPHEKVSRRVKAEDLARVIEDATVMHEMCMVGRGEYNTAYALAHSQINDQDPLRFFVTMKGEIYINPVITAHSHVLSQIQEGCMSYPEEPMRSVTRFEKVTVKYRTIAHKVSQSTGESVSEPYLTNEITSEFNGMMAQIMQHECQHFNGWDIYREGSGVFKGIGEPVKHKAVDITQT